MKDTQAGIRNFIALLTALQEDDKTVAAAIIADADRADLQSMLLVGAQMVAGIIHWFVPDLPIERFLTVLGHEAASLDG